MLQRIEVIEQPADRNRPAVSLEAVPKRRPEEQGPPVRGRYGGGNGHHHRPCGNCGRHHHRHAEDAAQEQHREAAPEHQPPPPWLADLFSRWHLVGWMESNLLKTHQAVRGSGDAAYASTVVRSSLEAFLDVVEEVMFRCDEVASGLPEEEGGARCPISGIWDELENRLVFYGKELRFVATMEVGNGA
jgi:hypothetical protein